VKKSVLSGIIPGQALSLAGVFLFPAAHLWLRAWVEDRFNLLQRMTLLEPNLLFIGRYYNQGVVLGYWSLTPYRNDMVGLRVFLPLIVLTLIVVLIRFVWSELKMPGRAGASLFAICGYSNVVEHGLNRYVVDTFQVAIGGERFLPFNLLDVGLLAGALLFCSEVYHSLRQGADSAISHPDESLA